VTADWCFNSYACGTAFESSFSVSLVTYFFFFLLSLLTIRFKRKPEVCLNVYHDEEVRDSAVGWGTVLLAGRPRFRFPLGLLRSYTDLTFPVHSACDRIEYQESLVGWGGVNAAGACGWQPCHFHVPIVWLSLEPSLNLLEPSGLSRTVQG
jgi:hypothetical protein